MQGMAIIPTEEYKELLQAQKDAIFYRKCYIDEKLKQTKTSAELNELLLLITKGQKKSQWTDGNFNSFDLADGQTIAEYINEKYLENGTLILKENDE